MRGDYEEIRYKAQTKATWKRKWISVLDYVKDGMKGNIGMPDYIDNNLDLEQSDFESKP